MPPGNAENPSRCYGSHLGASCQQASLGTAAIVEEGQGCTRVRSDSQSHCLGDAPVEGAVTVAADILPSFLIPCTLCLQPRGLTSWCLRSVVEHDRESRRQRSELTRPGSRLATVFSASACCLDPGKQPCLPLTLLFTGWTSGEDVNARACHWLH